MQYTQETAYDTTVIHFSLNEAFWSHINMINDTEEKCKQTQREKKVHYRNCLVLNSNINWYYQPIQDTHLIMKY